MPKELKIRLTDPAATGQKLIELGAHFEGEERAVHTYFNQPADRVLKLIESSEGAKQITFRRQGKGFVRTGRETVSDPAAQKQALAKSYGIADVLDMRSRTYQLENRKFSIYHISGRGDFLIQTADEPDPGLFASLGIEHPEYITVPFNELKKR